MIRDSQSASSLRRLVLLIDSLPLQRDGLVQLLHETCRDLRVVGVDPRFEPETLIDPPSLVIINIGRDDPAAAPIAIRRSVLPAVCAQAPILLLGERESLNDGIAAVNAGYAGLLPATQTGVQLCAAIHVLLAGGRFFLSLNPQNDPRLPS